MNYLKEFTKRYKKDIFLLLSIDIAICIIGIPILFIIINKAFGL